MSEQRPDEASGNRGATVVLELFRLGIVSAVTAAGYAAGPAVDELLGRGDPDATQLLSTVLGALVGYVLGGLVGRKAIAGVDAAQSRLARVDAAVLISTVVGATLMGLLAMLLLWPVLILPAKQFTVPVAMVILLLATYAGARLGATRGGDLLRFVGARGRLEVSSPSKGAGVKLVDTSALMDGRLVDVARAGFVDGTLVVPAFVLEEMQALADVEHPRRRAAARRGLDSLSALQDEGSVVVEVTQDDVPGVTEVDAKLVRLCRDRGAALITVDANLGRVAEISGVRVLNLHELADSLRPPVIPGDRVRLRIVKEGREPQQGVGYLPDGTMVVVERAAEQLDEWVTADVTSIMQSRQGRMLFAARVEGDDDADASRIRLVQGDNSTGGPG